MEETNLSPGGDIVEADDKPSAVCAVPMFKGLREYFGERKPNEDELELLMKDQEYALYSRGLTRFIAWSITLQDMAEEMSAAIDCGDYSAIDKMLDEHAKASPYSNQEFRKLLIKMALFGGKKQ